MSYVFTTELLSATAPTLGTPVLLGTSLSSTGAQGIDVAIVSLSAGAAGLTFTQVPILSTNQTLSSATVGDNSFKIAVGYNGQTFGILYPNRTVTIFTYSSATVAQTIVENTKEVTYPNKRRKWLLGYQ